MTTPPNPGLVIKSALVFKGITIKKLAQEADQPYPSLAHLFKKGTVPPRVAVALEKLGIGTALEWVKDSAAYHLALHLLEASSAKA